MAVIVRPAEPEDAAPIAALVNYYAAQNVMLPRSEESVRHTLADWLVAVDEDGGEPALLACGALVPLTDTLVELRSLAVDGSQQGRGLGGHLVLQLVQLARLRGFQQICALTLREQFFLRLGFESVDRWSISPKVWQACIYCRKFHHCDEVAVLMNLVDRPALADTASSLPAWSHLLKWSEWQPLKRAYHQPTPFRN